MGDTNVISITGKTAYSYAVPNACTSDKEMKDLTLVRSYLRELPVKRVEWTDFVEQIQAAANPVEAAHVFLKLAYPGDDTGKNVFASEPDGSKRISKHDRLRLREQIEEAREQSEEEAQSRGLWCGQELLRQMEVAGKQEWNGVPMENKVCAIFTRYLLTSGMMKYVHKES